MYDVVGLLVDGGREVPLGEDLLYGGVREAGDVIGRLSLEELWWTLRT